MYILYNDKKYPCKCRPSSTMRYSGLPDDFPAPVDGVIELYADDGFLMRSDVTEDYLRQTFAGGVLVLTNMPEPEPVEPSEPEPDVWDELDKAYSEGVNSI